jgi:hypothetical protein
MNKSMKSSNTPQEVTTPNVFYNSKYLTSTRKNMISEDLLATFYGGKFNEKTHT